MRQFAALLTVLCSLLCATAQVVVVVVEPVEGLPPEGFTPLSLDSSFSFAETNLSAILDIDLFPDGRLAYAGVDKPGNITMTMGEATESGALSRPNFGGSLMVEARSVAVDSRELVFYGAGVPQDPASTNLFDSPLRKIVGISDYWAWSANDNGLIG